MRKARDGCVNVTKSFGVSVLLKLARVKEIPEENGKLLLHNFEDVNYKVTAAIKQHNIQLKIK